MANWFRPLIGRDPYNKKNVDDAQKTTLKAVGVLEQYLLVNTFLVGERITLADLYAAGICSRGFQFVFDKQWRSEHPNLTRWYETVYHQPIYSAVAGELKFIDEAVKYEPPKKEKAPKSEKKEQPKAEPQPKQKEADEEEEEDKPAEPKSKHPLDALPKPSLPLDEWKRQFSNCNKKYRAVAMPWFWEHYNPEEYSLWRMDYPLNHELGMTFQSNNLIGKRPSPFELLYLSTNCFFQAVSTIALKLPENTSSAELLSTARTITTSFGARMLYAVKRLSQRLVLLPCGKALPLPSSTQTSQRIRNMSKMNGVRTWKLSKSTERRRNTMMANGSSRAF